MAKTTIGQWGNSWGVRIPQDVARAAGLKKGDSVEFAAAGDGVLEVRRVAQESAHRRVRPLRGVTFDMLFRGCTPGQWGDATAWPGDELVGAEAEAWA